MQTAEWRNMVPLITDIGCVTGRFQPVHNGHIELFQTVLDVHSRLIVAITNPDPQTRWRHPNHASRHLEEANPFTFYERTTMVHAACQFVGISREQYDVVPFPLHEPERVTHYVPTNIIQYVRIFSSWEAGKAKMLQDYGYPVQSIDGNPATKIAASAVREGFGTGSDWRHLVPAPVADLVDYYRKRWSTFTSPAQ
tara:strand:+ start:257 stop:844 length:588 start_codon:yes stop_codon:yes gene_type:complete